MAVKEIKVSAKKFSKNIGDLARAVENKETVDQEISSIWNLKIKQTKLKNDPTKQSGNPTKQSGKKYDEMEDSTESWREDPWHDKQLERIRPENRRRAECTSLHIPQRKREYVGCCLWMI